MSLVTLDAVLDCLEVRPAGNDRFTASNLAYPGDRVFGGQILGQLVALAASHPVKRLGSAHVVFCREGALDLPLVYERRVVREGRSMATWDVEVRQGDTVLATALLSLRAGGGDLRHRPVNGRALLDPPDGVVDPELIPWTVRSDIDLADTAAGPAAYHWAMRVDDLGDRPPWQHDALLAYTTDLTLIPTALRPFPGVGSGDAHRTFITAVTSHTLWFHRPADLSCWMRCEQQVASVEGSFAFGTGAAWDSVGEPVASYAQESLVRVAQGATTP